MGQPFPPSYDSSKTEAIYEGSEGSPAFSSEAAPGNQDSWIRWVEKGPLRATVRTHHAWRLLKFETYVTLCAGLPWVEVTTPGAGGNPPSHGRLCSARASLSRRNPAGLLAELCTQLQPRLSDS